MNYQLLLNLSKQSIRACGTVKENALDIVYSRQTKRYRSKTEELMISDQTEPCSV